MVNNSKMTPNSASTSTSWSVFTRPKPLGPQRRPVTKKPTMDGMRRWWHKNKTTIDNPKIMTISFRISV